MLFLEILFLVLGIILFSVLFFSVSYQDKIFGIKPMSIYFGHEINISKNNGTSELAQIAAEGNNVYVVWQDNTNGNYDVYYTYSLDKGKSFKPIQNLSKNNGTSELPQIAAEGNNVYVVWQDNTNGNYDVFLKSSTNGIKFTDIRNLSKNNGTSELPQIAALNNDIYVIWKDSTNGAGSISVKHAQIENSTKLKFDYSNNLFSNGSIFEPKIISGHNFTYGLWTSKLNDSNVNVLKFYPLKLFDYSDNIIPLTRLSSQDNIANVSAYVYDTDTYLVWENSKVGHGDIFFKRLSTKFFDRNS
jgi:hypothetical protein